MLAAAEPELEPKPEPVAPASAAVKEEEADLRLGRPNPEEARVFGVVPTFNKGAREQLTLMDAHLYDAGGLSDQLAAACREFYGPSYGAHTPCRP